MYVATIRRFNYSGHESKKQSAVHDFDTPVTLRQGQGEQILYKLDDPQQGYNRAESEKTHFNNVRNAKQKVHVFVKFENTSVTLEYVRKLKIMLDS